MHQSKQASRFICCSFLRYLASGSFSRQKLTLWPACPPMGSWHLPVTGMCSRAWLSPQRLGIWTQVIMLREQVLFQWAIYPAPQTLGLEYLVLTDQQALWSSCLHLPHPGMADMSPMPSSLWVLESVLRSSWLCGKHFINWAISPAHLRSLLK